MRAVVLARVRAVEVRDVADPVAGPGETLVEVRAAGICGIDRKAFAGEGSWALPGLVLGHEVVGLAGGRRVAVDPLMNCGNCAECVRGAENLCAHVRVPGMGGAQGWMMERIAVPSRKVLAIEDAVPDERAVLAEPLANVVHLFHAAEIRAGMRVAVVGMGLMGAMALQLARRMGAREVIAVDAMEVRVDTARTMGATHAVMDAAEARRCAGYGVDVTIDAAGIGEARRLALEMVRPGGTAMLLGMAEKRSEVDFGAAIRREVCVRTSFGYTRKDFGEALDLLTAGAVDLSAWTRVLPMEDAQRAFELAAGEGEVLKVALKPGKRG
jgi:2-desacetyl-2-hydroxyethyl bacteriochlorophyllide A dehydrogenase